MTGGLALEFIDPSGEPLRIEWDSGALTALDPSTPGSEPVWALGGELDWDEIETLRIVSGHLDDGRLLAIAALRPAGADGHGDEVVAGGLGDGEAFDQLSEALFSTEYGPDGLPRRIGVELYRDDGGLPVRIAGDATATRTEVEGRVRRLSTALALRSSGATGVGVLDVLTLA